MSRQRIDITVPEHRLASDAGSRARLAAARQFEPVDRVPVLISTNQWYLLDQRGVSAGQYVAGPRENMEHQLLNLKWRIENIEDDQPLPTDALMLSPDLGCLRGTEFEMEVTWQEDQPPKCEHPLREPEQIDSLVVPDPAGGINRIRIDWYNQMRAMVDDFDVRFNGQRLDLRVSIRAQGGPIPAAYALAGDNLLLWLAMDPDRAAALLEITARSHINCIRYFDELCGRPTEHPVGMGCDIAEMLSPDMFRQFVVPACERVWQAYPGRRQLHMCGNINHLFEILRDDMKLNELHGFGFPADAQKMAAAWAGRIVMLGGPSPILVKDGPIDQIIQTCIDYIDCLNQRGGYILTPGFGVAVGTPPQHLNVMVDAARRAALDRCRARDAQPTCQPI